MSSGIVSGPHAKERIVCQYANALAPDGIWFGDDPFDHTSTIFFAQVVLIFFLSRSIFILLKPLRQSVVTAQVLAGIVIGPTFLGRFFGNYTERLFPLSSKVVLQTLANIGFLLHFFILGVQMDTGIFRKAGGPAVLIGVVGFLMPFAVGGITYFMVNRIMTLDPKVVTCLPFIVAVNSLSSFPSVTGLLADLQILNSEMGRLATSTSMVNDFVNQMAAIVITTLGVAVRSSKWISFWATVWFVIFLTTVIFVFRPFIIWLIKRTPEGGHMKESHFLVVLLIMFSCAALAEINGQHAGFGSLWLGLVLPDGPPLGSTLVHRLDLMATELLLPVYVAISGLQTDLLSGLGGNSSVIIELVIIMGYIGKFCGTLLAAIYCSVPLWEAVTLALIMSYKGLVEVTTYILWKDSNILDDQAFSLMLITMLLVSGLAGPMVRLLYDPSSRYMANGRRSILESGDNIQLRILVCIHQEDDVPMILNLLESSHSTRISPISVIVLHLVELTGRAAAILVPHHRLYKSNSAASSAEHVFSAFRQFEEQHEGSIVAQHFTSASPYASMHDDICNLAMDKRATIVIVPFHKQWAIDGRVGSSKPSIRIVNLKVMNKAPCSVGVLLDRGNGSGNQFALTSRSSYHIGLLFFGGADDLEALAYGRRMAQHPYISVTVVRFIHESHKYGEENNPEDELIHEFIANALMKGKNQYKQEIVGDGVETTEAIHAMEGDFDLVIVGKYHAPDSPLILGLTTEWSECPELGVIGDMLACSESRSSILVVQQQPQEAFPPESISPLPISRAKSFDSNKTSESSDGEDFTPNYARLAEGNKG